MPRRVFCWKFYDPDYEEKFKNFLKTLAGDSIQEKLNNFWETYLAPEEIGQPPQLEEYFTCPVTHQAVKIKDLPCLETPNFECHANPTCLLQLRQKYGKMLRYGKGKIRHNH